MPDKAFSRELNVLRIGCLYRKYEECPWTGMLQDYQVNNFFFENI